MNILLIADHTKYLNSVQCYLCCHFRIIQNDSSTVLHAQHHNCGHTYYAYISK